MITDGLVLDYRGTAKDWSRYHHTITNNNAVPVRGIKGDAMLFNGTNAYLDCGNDASLNITDAITIEAWVKYNTVTKDQAIFNQWTDDNNRVLIHLDDLNSKLKLFKVVGGVGDNIGYSDTVFQSNSWYHLTVKVDGTHWTIFVNGNQDAQFYETDVPFSGYVRVGAYQLAAGAGYYFNGTIDEVRIYNRALSAYEIWTHYNALKPYIPLKETPMAIV